jgi:hypothetical protein
MNKSDLINQLNTAHRRLLRLLQPFSQNAFEQPIAGDWTTKDICAHLAFWNWEAKKAIEQTLRDERPVMMLDANDAKINRREWERARSLPLPNVMDDFRRSQQALVAQLQLLNEADIYKTTAHFSGDHKNANAAWIIGGIIEHYQEHTQSIASGLERRVHDHFA